MIRSICPSIRGISSAMGDFSTGMKKRLPQLYSSSSFAHSKLEKEWTLHCCSSPERGVDRWVEYPRVPFLHATISWLQLAGGRSRKKEKQGKNHFFSSVWCFQRWFGAHFPFPHPWQVGHKASLFHAFWVCSEYGSQHSLILFISRGNNADKGDCPSHRHF